MASSREDLYSCQSQVFLIAPLLTVHTSPSSCSKLSPPSIATFPLNLQHIEGPESESVSHIAVSSSYSPMDCSPPAPLSLGFSRQEDWSGLPFPSPEDLPNPGIESRSPALQADSLPSEPPGKPTYRVLLLSRFSRVQLCATPQTAAHEAPPSLGFSRQEHWSGLPFPSPMHESEK